METPHSEFNEVDLSFGVEQPVTGITGVLTQTEYGPLNRPDIIISSWTEYQKYYGGLVPGMQGPTLAKRALDRGSALRINRMNHYNDISDPLSYDAEYAVAGKTWKLTFNAGVGIPVGEAATVTQGATNVVQVYDTSMLITMQKLRDKLLLEPWVRDARVENAGTLWVATNNAVNVTAAASNGAAAYVGYTAFMRLTTGAQIFAFTPKNPGADGNNIIIRAEAPSNGLAGYFNVRVMHLTQGHRNELYQNIKPIAGLSAAQSTYLKEVADKSSLVTPVYYDLLGQAGPIVPSFYQSMGFGAGTEGAAIVAADYIGSGIGKTGFNAFDGIDDIAAIAILDNVAGLVGVHEAGSAYAANRKDTKYFMHLGAQGDTETDVIAMRNALNINSSYTRIFAGGVRHVNIQTGLEEWVPELGDVLGIAAYSEAKFGPYMDFAGRNRGTINNALGSGNAWGSLGNKANLDALANAQINPVIDRYKTTYLLSNYTAQIDYSQLSFGNVRDGVIYIRKALSPIADRYLNEPCEPTSWKKLYLEGKAFLDTLIPLRAINDYDWKGDQFAKSISPADLKINNAADVAQGKYRVRLFLQMIVSMVWISVDIVITPSSVSFEDALEIVNP